MHSAMMHYRPWPQYQQMLIEQHPYYQYVTHDMHLQYSMNEHQVDVYDHSRDEIPSESSDDQNQHADMFRLKFAASQCSKLVLNAEGLFTKLSALLPNEQNLLKNQIAEWLFLKQEYEECIANDESASLHGYTENTRRSLERIEEVTETTETDEKTDESNNWAHKQLQDRNKSYSSASLNTSSGSETSNSATDVTDDSDESDVDSENSDFIDKLDESMRKFEIDTDDVINSMVNDFLRSKDNFPQSYNTNSQMSVGENEISTRNNSPEVNSDIRNNLTTAANSTPIRKLSTRRSSILPNSKMIDELAEFQKQNCHFNSVNFQQSNNHEDLPVADFDSNKNTDAEVEYNQNCEETSLNTNIKSESMKIDSSISIDFEHLNTLKALRIDIIEKQSKVKKIQTTLDSLRSQIKEFQSAIEDREHFIEDIRQNFATRNTAKQKYREWQSKYEEKYHKYEKLLKKLQRNVGDNQSHQQEMAKYEQLLIRYDKKLRDIENIKQIVDNSKTTLEYSKAAINKFRKEMEVLKLQLKTEEKRKEELDSEIIDCQKKVKELDRVCNLTPANLKKILSASEDGKNHKMKGKCDRNECSTEVNTKNLSINDSLKGKSNYDNVEGIDEKESLRKEIRDLRHIRDLLIKMQCEKSSAKMTPTTKIERQVLHLSEFIECIDAMIEEKNVMICSKADFNQNRSNKLDEHIPIFSRLEKLSHKELVTLFYKYFYKVIDLKESSQTLEIQNTILEGNFKSLEMDYEKKLVDLQRSYERQITILLSSYPDDSSSSVCDSKIDRNREIVRLMKENQHLKTRLAYFESLLKTCKPVSNQSIPPHALRVTKPSMKPQLMHVESPQKPYFREGNKIIFKKCDKK